MSLKPSEVLSEAADLIEPKGRWTQGRMASLASGEAVCDPRVSGATCFCMEGAVRAVMGIDEMDPRFVRLAGRYLQRTIGDFAVWMWNDRPERKQSEVVEALRKASALALSEGQ